MGQPIVAQGIAQNGYGLFLSSDLVKWHGSSS
jgi:hypothetical protein